MESVCSDILEQVQLMDTPSRLMVIAIAVQLSSDRKVKAIQIRKDDCNIVFNVSPFYYFGRAVILSNYYLKTTGFTSRAHFPAALRAVLTSNLIIKLGCNIKQALLDVAVAYNDPEIQLALRSNPPILELSQHAKLKGFVREGSASLHVLVGKVLKKCFNPPTPTEMWNSTSYAHRLHTHIETIWQVYLSMNVNTSVGLPLVKAQLETNGYLVTLFQASVPVAEGLIIWPRSNFIDVVKDGEGNHQKIKITPTCSLIQVTKVLRPNSIHRRHGQCLSWIFDHEKLAVVTTSMLRTRGVISPISSSSSDSDIAAIPVVNLTEPFTLSIPPNGEPFPQMIDEDQDIFEEPDNEDLDTDRVTVNREEQIAINDTTPGPAAVRNLKLLLIL
jgi:hypothetical protein